MMRLRNMDKTDARGALTDCAIFRGTDGLWPDFHTLRSHHVEAILEVAREMRYRKPRFANGSRGRYLYSALVRIADHI